MPRLLQRNAPSHADRDGDGCPSAPAMQHCGGADQADLHPLATNSWIARTRAAASPASVDCWIRRRAVSRPASAEPPFAAATESPNRL
jgi:hypothetical protein